MLSRRLTISLRPYLLALFLVTVVSACALAGRPARDARDVRLITIVNISDWHGHLEPLTMNIDGKSRRVGGAAVLKYYFDQERRRNPGGTLIVTAGDAVGATPPVSGFFEDVPAIEAQNAMGFDIDTLGNHHFDHGLPRLRKLMSIARFPYVAANVVSQDGQRLAPPYHVFTRSGVQVGIIGIAHPQTPEMVGNPDVNRYKFLDPAPVINSSVAELRSQGVGIVVVIAHIGAIAVTPGGVPVGPLTDLARRIRGVDLLIGDHTDVSVNALVNAALVLENRSHGVQYTVIDVEYDAAKQMVVRKSATQKWAYVDGASPDANVQASIDSYKAQIQPQLDKKVGETGVLLTGAREESLLGNLVTDILRTHYNVQIAFYNSFGLRANIPSSYQPADPKLRRPGPPYAAGPPYDIVVGDLLAVEPFKNVAVTFRITGKALWEALEHSTRGGPLQISGFKFAVDPRLPLGQRVLSVALSDGTPIRTNAAEYTAVTINFLYNGGDGYKMLNNGTGVSREPITEILRQALQQMGMVHPRIEGRITRVQ